MVYRRYFGPHCHLLRSLFSPHPRPFSFVLLRAVNPSRRDEIYLQYLVPRILPFSLPLFPFSPFFHPPPFHWRIMLNPGWPFSHHEIDRHPWGDDFRWFAVCVPFCPFCVSPVVRGAFFSTFFLPVRQKPPFSPPVLSPPVSIAIPPPPMTDTDWRLSVGYLALLWFAFCFAFFSLSSLY